MKNYSPPNKPIDTTPQLGDVKCLHPKPSPGAQTPPKILTTLRRRGQKVSTCGWGGLHVPILRGETTHCPLSLSFHRSQERAEQDSLGTVFCQSASRSAAPAR